MSGIARLAVVILLGTLWLSGQTVPGRYLVVLEGEPVAAAGGGPGRAAEAAAELRLAQEQSRAAARLAAMGARVRGRVTYAGNALLVEAAGAEREALQSIPGVRRVEPVVEVRMHLDAALPVHSVPEAWAISGGEWLAGLGVKIGILDSGIDSSHPGFQDPSLPVLPGYPMVNDPVDLPRTNNKILVVRNYEILSGLSDRNGGDQQGHGTAVAMVAAGARHMSPLGPISGVAPKAYIGSYKVFPGTAERTSSDVVVKAYDDAVRDGMNVINMSLGSSVAPRPRDSLLAEMVERAGALGIVTVVSAGNSGPSANTIGSAAVGPAAIAVGAIVNARTRSTTVTVGGTQFVSIPGNGSNQTNVSAPMVDVTTLDPTGLACDTLPGGSLAGRIALILRGVCNFSVKLANAQTAGAEGAVVYTDSARPEPITMAVAGVTLPAQMVSHADGLRIKELLRNSPGLSASLDFQQRPVSQAPNRLGSFSSRGPNTDLGVKPDLVAVGSQVYTASIQSRGSYETISGTSFSAPMVAGAAAVLQRARPNFPVRQYRSLLVNAVQPLLLASGGVAPVQQAGSGRLDLERSLRSVLAAFPVSLGFGVGDGNPDREQSFTLQNIGGRTETVSVAPVAFQLPVPQVTPPVVTLGPGESAVVRVRLTGANLAPGTVDGLIRVSGASTGVDLHLAYWYGRTDAAVREIAVLETTSEGRPGSTIRAADFRILNAAGVALTAPVPTATVVSGTGTIVGVTLNDGDSPGVFTLRVRAATGTTVFRVEAGGVTREFTVIGTSTALREQPQIQRAP